MHWTLIYQVDCAAINIWWRTNGCVYFEVTIILHGHNFPDAPGGDTEGCNYGDSLLIEYTVLCVHCHRRTRTKSGSRVTYIGDWRGRDILGVFKTNGLTYCGDNMWIRMDIDSKPFSIVYVLSSLQGHNLSHNTWLGVPRDGTLSGCRPNISVEGLCTHETERSVLILMNNTAHITCSTWPDKMGGRYSDCI